MAMGTIVKVQGNSKEVIREVDVDDLYSASMEAYAEAIKANKRSCRKGERINYMTKFLIVQAEKIHGGYYAMGLQYTDN